MEDDDEDESPEPENGEQLELRVIVISERNVSMLGYLIISLTNVLAYLQTRQTLSEPSARVHS